MGHHFGDNVRVADNLEIETPALVDTGLPAVLAFVILLGVQRRVLEVISEEPKLLIKSLLHGQRRIFQSLNNEIGQDDFHEAFRLLLRAQISLCKNLTASLALLKGPWTRPALMSSSALSSRASMIRRCAGVYSSSAVGNLERSITSRGVMTILPRWKAKFTRSPLERPAWRRTLVGIVTWPLCWILAVVFIKRTPINSGSQESRLLPVA